MVISLTGEWDGCRMQQLRERLAPAYEQSHIVLDLTRAKYVTSALIGALLLAHKHRAACGMPAASIAVRSAFVRGLLSSAGVDELYPIYESVDEALRHQSAVLFVEAGDSALR